MIKSKMANRYSPEVRARFKAAEERLTELAALGVVSESTWNHDSPGTHLRMTARHLKRACTLAGVR
ncbi:hypothetical protein, partial [Sulfitobacter sp. TMED3]|uniref:hypothetical protein n=1 Tax=Sulfitobacter sp. TMED3 TaxID=1986591 RepID=UPI000B7623B3